MSRNGACIAALKACQHGATSFHTVLTSYPRLSRGKGWSCQHHMAVASVSHGVDKRV
jgi:hypothetical protein